MASQRLNPDRIRRHMARSTPDEIQTEFDPIEDNIQQKYEKWVHEFMCRMKIKHGRDVIVDVFIDETISRSFNQRITARVHGR